MKKREKNTEAYRIWLLSEQVMEERFCLDGMPVLYVRCVYPMLSQAEGREGCRIAATVQGAEQFNEGYSQGARTFVCRGLALAKPRITALYEAMGDRAVHGFLRREWCCSMRAEMQGTTDEAGVSEETQAGTACLLRVKIQRSFGLRRKSHGEVTFICEHLWQFPRGILLRREPKYERTIKKVAKNY